MNYETDLLNRLYQNTKMGEQTLEMILKKTKNPKLHKTVREQKNGYSHFSQQVERQLHLRQEVPKELSPVSKWSVTVGVKSNLMKNHFPSHLAEMMIQGSTMGLIDATQHLHKYCHCISRETRQLTEEVIQFEEQNINSLKTFL
ncbi:MAG: hypothetical protein ACOX60_08705 [Massiliimalia sp.]|jgi:hypothetical protein